MPDLNTSAEKEQPTESELVKEVPTRGNGIDAVALGKKFESRGYRRYGIQRAIRRALDNGAIELGPKLRLYRKRSRA